MLELSAYEGIPHLLTPVITDSKKATAALGWTVREMNNRYKLMSKVGVRNIDGYNSKHKLKMPYIVVVVDEMSDLMLVSGKEIENYIQKLSQMARAAGIHIIMATQRPSVDVITGTIKANFPTRISFQVSSKIDSRTILGEQGAEQLLGKGDMLFMSSANRIIRIHGPFISEKEIEKIVEVEVPKEVEVEKIVEKIVEVEVPVEKVAIKEVPVEIVRKELVYVPLYSTDSGLIDASTELKGAKPKIDPETRDTNDATASNSQSGAPKAATKKQTTRKKKRQT